MHAVGLDLGGSGLDESPHLSNVSKSWSILGGTRGFLMAWDWRDSQFSGALPPVMDMGECGKAPPGSAKPGLRCTTTAAEGSSVKH